MIETTSYRRDNSNGDGYKQIDIVTNAPTFPESLKLLKYVAKLKSELDHIPFTMNCIYFVGEHFAQ